MPEPPIHRSRTALRRPTALVLLGLQILACTSWKTPAVSPQELVAGETPKAVRVTRSDGSQVVVIRPRVTGDNLTGQRPGRTDASHPAQEVVVVPLSDIRSVAVRRGDTGRTVLLIVGLGLTAAAATLLVAIASIDAL
jgi:hypothetical protein